MYWQSCSSCSSSILLFSIIRYSVSQGDSICIFVIFVFLYLCILSCTCVCAFTELGVSCRGGHSVSQVDSHAHYFPIQDLTPVCLHVDSSAAECPAHYISISTICTCLLPLLCSAGCIISSSGPGPSSPSRATRAIPM